MQSNQSIPEQTMVVILAAGKGTRMGRSDMGKVCFEIDGVPAINRQITAFKRRRFSRFLLVVGSKAEQVLAAVTRDHPGVLCVYQEPQLGTGHAAKLAADALQTAGYQGYVLVAMGDKYLEEAALDALVAGYVKQRADLALLTIPRTKATEGSVGRVFVDESGQALDIIERVDLARQMIADDLAARLAGDEDLTAQDLAEIVGRHIPNPAKQQAAVGDLLALGRANQPIDRRKLQRVLQSDKYNLRVGGQCYSGKQLDKLCSGVNPSLYLMRADVFYTAMGMVCRVGQVANLPHNDNAQGEYYITDMVRLLAGLRDDRGEPRLRIRAVPIDHPEWIQGFNSPDELLAIQDYVRRKKLDVEHAAEAVGRPQLRPSQYATVRQWLERIEGGRSSLKRWLRSVYGPNEALHRQKCKDLAGVLECYGRRFGFDQPVCIVRAPGRINLMGRHVDHRGGMTNFLAIDRETLAVAGLRDDANVVAINARPMKFRAVEFNVMDLIGRFAWSDWLNFVNSDWVRNIVYLAAGDWGNYIKAAMLRLQHRYQDVRVRGINMALSGNVPIAAGLSSSSTIVVATLQAAIALNGFELTSQQFIDLCGEGEWFVGSRGGAGDHAAIYLGQRGKIAHVGYLPFRVEKIIDAPPGYQVVIANSHVKAAKSATARHEFNARIAAYNLGFALLKQRSPEIAELEYLRDLNPAHLGCTPSDVYRWLLKVPERMTRKDFQNMLSREHRELVEASFATHAEPPAYWPRGVLLFGIAEILRSGLCPELIESGQVETLGRLMKVSHDGDRVSRPGPDGSYQAVAESPSDQLLQRLIADLASENPNRVLMAQLYMQPGYYACSTPEIDQMVDIASAVPGVAGAQIAGAGLGGCIMVLVKKESVETLRRALAAKYYRPRGLEPAAMLCTTVEGAGLVEF
jgi:N-acetylgalactosamine kinase